MLFICYYSLGLLSLISYFYYEIKVLKGLHARPRELCSKMDTKSSKSRFVTSQKPQLIGTTLMTLRFSFLVLTHTRMCVSTVYTQYLPKLGEKVTLGWDLDPRPLYSRAVSYQLDHQDCW